MFKVGKPIEFQPWPGMIVGELPTRSTVAIDCPGCRRTQTYPRRRLIAWAGLGRRIDTLWHDYGCQLCDPRALVVAILRLPNPRLRPETAEGDAPAEGPRYMPRFGSLKDT